MTLPVSGALNLSMLPGEYGGVAPHYLSEYRGAGPGVPATGPLKLSDFYGKSAMFILNITASIANPNIWQLARNAGWNGTHLLVVTFNCPYVNTIKLPFSAGQTFPGGLRLEFAQSCFFGGVYNSGWALQTALPVTVKHPGTIAGGGGQGGTGDLNWYQWTRDSPIVLANGGQGGQGQGFASLASVSLVAARQGDAGEFYKYSGDLIGGQSPSWAEGGRGGTGGNWGQTGAQGSYGGSYKGDGYAVSSPAPGGGGTGAGYYAYGNRFITWDGPGTRLGPVAA